MIGSIALDTSSFTEARNCLAVSQRLLQGLSGFCQGFEVEYRFSSPSVLQDGYNILCVEQVKVVLLPSQQL